MSDVIQCPQCDKRYRLPEKVPPTFACKGCGTLMDLSGFGAAPAAPLPVAPAAPAAGGAARKGRTRRQGGGAPAPSHRPHAGGARRRGGARRGRRSGAEIDEEHGGYAERAKQKQGNGLIIGSAIGLVAAVILAIVMAKKMGKDDPGPKKDPTKIVAENAGGDGADATKGGAKGATPEAGTSGKAGVKGEGEGEGEGEASGAPPAKKGGSVNVGGLKLEKWPWPEDVDEATRAQIDEAIENLYRGGRDGNDAEEFLVGKGRIIGGRLISEFRRIEESPGFQSRDGASMASAIETVLRKIDGVIERKFFDEEHIRASSQPSFILGQAKRWTWWWKNEEWKTNPREPFDPFSESVEDLKEAAKGGTTKKKKDFGKRAGDEDE